MTSKFLEVLFNDVIRSRLIAIGIGFLIPTLLGMIVNTYIRSENLKLHFINSKFPFEFWNNLFMMCITLSIICIIYGVFTRKPK